MFVHYVRKEKKPFEEGREEETFESYFLQYSRQIWDFD
jgi:hypothetical protein